MKTPRRLLLAAGILALGAGIPVSAQQVTVTASIPLLLTLTIENTDVSFVFAPGDYAADGTSTKVAATQTNLKVTANTNWQITVAANNPSFTYTPDVGISAGTTANKACGDLALSLNEAATYQPVTTTATKIAWGAAGGNAVPANTVRVAYQLNTTLAGDPPGNYVLTLNYTLLPL